MKYRKVIGYWLLVIGFVSSLHAASVEAVLSQPEVVAGNMAQLRIIAEGDRAQFPDIRQIDGVPVQGRSQTQHTSLQIINGKSSVAHTTNLILTFAPTKDMDIPSYTVTIDGKAYKTNPLHLKVVKSTAPSAVSTGKFSLMLKANKTEVSVGEPLLVTVYFSLRNDVRLSDNPQYQRPAFKGFFVKEVKGERSYIKGDHRITELRYILTPEKAGDYILGPATAKVGVADTSRRDFIGRFFGTIWQPLRSNTVSVHVKPLAQDADLIGNFHVEASLDKTEVKANQPVNLTVTIEGEGSLEDFDLENYEIDDVTVYGDDAETHTEVIGDRLKSTYVKKFVFISDHDFVIPERTLSMYDPERNVTKTLHIPAYQVHVKASHHTVSAPLQTGSDEQSGKVQTNLKLTQPSATDVASEPSEKAVSVAWWMVALAFLAGMVTTYLLGKLHWRKPKASPFKESEALKILYAHMSEDEKVEAMVRKLYAKKNGQKDVTIDKKELKALVEKYRNR